MKPFYAGRKAFYSPTFNKTKKGYILEGNPHQEGTKDHTDWEFGYNKGYYENLERVKERESRTGS